MSYLPIMHKQKENQQNTLCKLNIESNEYD